MGQARWKTLEEQARGIAGLVFGAPCKAGQISGINFDGVIEVDPLQTVAIEVSLEFNVDKVRQGVTRIASARLKQAADGIVLRGYIVLTREPTPAMAKIGDDNKITVLSISQLAALFFQFPRYRDSREKAAFGSSIDPLTGDTDMTDYVPVSYTDIASGQSYSVANVSEALLSGKNIVLLGEYGSGKSRCIRQIFKHLADEWDLNFVFPFAVNLRECWGLDRADEIIRRSMDVLGLDEIKSGAVRALNSQSLILLLDGFDEIGSQAWSVEEARLRQLRARALSGVKDAILRSATGTLIAGREHYFSSNEEMFAALGLQGHNTMVLRANDEFSEEELELYFERAGIYVDLPSWLPRRPLICQTISLLDDIELNEMFGVYSHEAAFWNHFIKVVCERDARINAFFDSNTIYHVFIALSRITRNKPANIGPVSQRDLQDAFEEVVGQLPVEEAAVMLLRLPSLGRIGPNSSDRQFVDMFILDGLRAKDVAGLVDVDDAERRRACEDAWANPLQALGQSVLSLDIQKRADSFIQLAKQSAKSKNHTLAGDILSSACLSDMSIDAQSLILKGASISRLQLDTAKIFNFSLSESTIEYLVLPNSPPKNVSINNCLVGSVSGAASYSGLPRWVQLDSVDRFDSVQTVAQIRRVGLSPAHEVLVSVLKKTFLQRGSGRKEEALLRGFGSGAIRKIATEVVALLMREGLLDRHKGDEGWIYNPQRSHTDRVKRLLDQLRSSDDPLWIAVERYNRI